MGRSRSCERKGAVVPGPPLASRPMNSETSPAIELRGASKAFRTPSGALHTAVRDLDLTIGRGEFVAVVGPTGCGKSTTLTLVSGLEEPTEGEVLVAGEPVRGIGDKVGFVFQQDAVFPWRTVLSNVMAGPVSGAYRSPRRSNAPGSGSPGSACPPSRTAIPTSCPAASASESHSRPRSSTIPRFCSWTNPSPHLMCRPGP